MILNFLFLFFSTVSNRYFGRLSGIYDYYIKSRSTIQLEPSDIWHSLSIKNDLTPNQEGIQIQVRETEFDGLVKKATLNARRNDFENGHLTYE